MPRMPQVGVKYRRKGGGFVSVYVGMNDEVAARIMADAYDVGYVTGMMPVASFWEMVE